LEKFDCLKVVASATVLSRLKSFDQYGLQSDDHNLGAYARKIGIHPEASVTPNGVDSKPKKPVPSAVQTIDGMLIEPFTEALICDTADIYHALRIMKKIHPYLFAKIDRF